MSSDTPNVPPTTTATSPTSSPKPPARAGTTTPPTNQSLADRMRTDTCFKCQKQGHWARDCPKIPQKAVTRTQLFAKQNTNFPVVMSPRGHASCSAQTSSSEKNPNRKYYECPLKRNGGCDFFKWYDEMSLPESVPACDCGAGKCCVDRAKDGPNAGRWLFTCRVRKGHGACQFFQWEDAQSQATNNGEPAKDVNNGSDRGDSSSFQPAKKTRIESSMMHNHHRSSSSASVPGPSSAAPSTVARALDFSAMLETETETIKDLESGIVRPLQNYLCSFLELNCLSDPVSMERVAKPIVDALDSLSADNKQFRSRVGEFISCASSFAQFEQPVSNEPNLQDVLDMEKGKLDDISRKHSEAMDALSASREEASCLKETLVRIENQLSRCEAQMEKRKARADEICKEKAECESNLQIAEEALRRSRNREEERFAAKEAFDKARNQLRRGDY